MGVPRKGRLTLTERLEPVTTRREWHSHIKKHNGYRSKFEANIAEQLDKSGVRYGYEVSRIFYGRGQYYVPDFTLYYPDGSEFYIEAKGWIDRKAHEKMVRVRDYHTHLDLRFVFQNGKTRVANLKSNVCQWSSRLHFRWAVGEVPDQWIAEGANAPCITPT